MMLAVLGTSETFPKIILSRLLGLTSIYRDSRIIVIPSTPEDLRSSLVKILSYRGMTSIHRDSRIIVIPSTPEDLRSSLVNFLS